MRACCDPTQHMCRCPPTANAYPRPAGIAFYNRQGRGARSSRLPALAGRQDDATVDSFAFGVDGIIHEYIHGW